MIHPTISSHPTLTSLKTNTAASSRQTPKRHRCVATQPCRADNRASASQESPTISSHLIVRPPRPNLPCLPSTEYHLAIASARCCCCSRPRACMACMGCSISSRRGRIQGVEGMRWQSTWLHRDSARRWYTLSIIVYTILAIQVRLCVRLLVCPVVRPPTWANRCGAQPRAFELSGFLFISGATQAAARGCVFVRNVGRCLLPAPSCVLLFGQHQIPQYGVRYVHVRSSSRLASKVVPGDRGEMDRVSHGGGVGSSRHASPSCLQGPARSAVRIWLREYHQRVGAYYPDAGRGRGRVRVLVSEHLDRLKTYPTRCLSHPSSSHA